MPTIHRTIEAAVAEAKELLHRYQIKSCYIVKNPRVRAYDLADGYTAEPPFEPNNSLNSPIIGVVTNSGVSIKETQNV